MVELLEDGRNARLVAPGDVRGAARALAQLLQDRSLCRRLGEGARESSLDLTWDARAQKILRPKKLRKKACLHR